LYAHMSNKTIKKKKKTVHEEYILKATWIQFYHCYSPTS
jgi:hypothetical protein